MTTARIGRSLSERVAIVTGAAGLLGEEHCRALAEEGASVVVADLDADRAARLARELSASYGEGIYWQELDVTSEASVLALKRAVLERFGRIDVLVNNAAIDDKFEPERSLEESRFENYSVERFARQIAVNVTGVFSCCRHIGAELAERGRGSIINIASTYGLVAPDQSLYVKPDGTRAFFKGPAYPTSKGALLQLTRYLAAYWGERGVRVNALCPGGVEAGQAEWFQSAYADRTALGRMAKKSDYRGALVFLASDASAYMTGATLVVDGGYTIT